MERRTEGEARIGAAVCLNDNVPGEMTEFCDCENREDVGVLATRREEADKRVNTQNAISALICPTTAREANSLGEGWRREDVHPFVVASRKKSPPPPSIGYDEDGDRRDSGGAIVQKQQNRKKKS